MQSRVNITTALTISTAGLAVTGNGNLFTVSNFISITEVITFVNTVILGAGSRFELRSIYDQPNSWNEFHKQFLLHRFLRERDVDKLHGDGYGFG